MKTNKLLFGVVGIALFGGVALTGFSLYNGNRSLYSPSKAVAFEAASEEQEIRGSAEWFFNNQKNPAGIIDERAMVAAQKQVEAQMMLQSNTITTASAAWTELGPDNVGGRTRAILIDKNNASHMLAGGISGGLWVSNDAAGNWTAHPQLSTMRNLCVSTICQAANGDIYFGTGEGLYYLLGTGAGGFIGGGIWKSTDGGTTFARLTATIPDSNSTSGQWASVNKMAADPTNPNRIYAATNKGLMMTDDGGATWTNPVVINNVTMQTKTPDVDVSSTGAVVAAVGNKPYISPNGNLGTFTNTGVAGSGFPTASVSRTEFAIAPSNPNYIYAACAKNGTPTLQGVYLSVDGGTTWTTLALGGNSLFEPFGSNGQGDYDNTLAVDPSDAGRVFFGGVELWKWELGQVNPSPAGTWTQVAFEFPASPFNPWYVHSDKHIIVFQPSNPNIMYVGCDGGVFKSMNKGQTYIAANKGYNVTQCYTVGYDYMASSRALAVAGCQDNGTQFIDGLGNTSMSATSINGGDGGYTEFSYINPNAVFSTVYYGSLSRSANRGSSSSDFYSSRIQAFTTLGSPGFASFVTPIALYENKNDANSHDSLKWYNNGIASTILLTAGGTATFTGTITPSQSSATILLDSVYFTDGYDTLYSNASGVISGDGTGSVQANGQYNITFTNTPPAGRLLTVHYYVMYNAGSVLIVNSKTNSTPFGYTTPSTINPGDSVMIQDIVQSRLVVGFSGTNGVWMTKSPIDFSTTPEWLKIADNLSKPDAFSGETQTMAWSADGKDLYVGTAAGSVYRLSNMHMVTDSASSDVDSLSGYNSSTPITCTRIGSFSQQAVTAIDVDPNNDRIIVSLGGYGFNNYIYLCNNASTAPSASNTSNFTVKQGSGSGKLTDMPVYSCSFDKYTPNRVLVGTEYGIYECSNINAASSSLVWAVSNSGGFPRVPTLAIHQSRHEPWEVQNAGVFYVATHGRGMWRDESSLQAPNGINQPGGNNGSATANIALNVFPNPVADGANVTFKLDKPGDATLSIYDLQGKKVFSQVYNNLNGGDNTIRFSAETLRAGTYLVNVTAGSKRIGTSRFVKLN